MHNIPSKPCICHAEVCNRFYDVMHTHTNTAYRPLRTRLVGEAQELASLYFYEQDNGTTLYDPAAGGAPGCKAHKYGGQGPWDSFCTEGYIYRYAHG